jgi:hypothetical protein
MSPIAEFDQLDNPYQATMYGAEPFVSDGSLDDYTSALRAFVGAKSDYYLRKWAPRLQDPAGETGMNWAAFFLTALWLAYRKMYKATFLFYAAVVGLWLAQVGVFMFALGLPQVPPIVSLVVNLMICLVCGAFGNGWYLNHANRIIASIRRQGIEGESLRLALAQRGGTSLAAALGLMFAPLIVFLVLGLIVAVLLAAAAR